MKTAKKTDAGLRHLIEQAVYRATEGKWVLADDQHRIIRALYKVLRPKVQQWKL